MSATARYDQDSKRPHVAVREEERGFAAAAHIVSAIPLWGLVFAALIWIYFKERSREVVFHVQQAMMFQAVFLGAACVYLAIELLRLPISVLSEGMSSVIGKANLFFLVVLFVIYLAICVGGAAMTMLGRPFLYPLVGRRILEGNLACAADEEA